MYLAIDVGGTNVRAAVLNNLNKPSISDRVVLKNNHNFDEYFQGIINFAKQSETIEGIGISATGDLNIEKTMVVDTSPNAPEIINAPIVETLSKEFRCRVFMENDGTASALGEAVYGSPEKDEFIYVIWGTGIGGAVVKRNNEKINVEQIDWYKHFETWEYLCGGDGIRNTLGKSAKDLSEGEWETIMNSFGVHLLELCKSYKTNSVVFGGGIALNQFTRIKQLKKQYGDKIPNVYLTKLGDDTGLYGGFALIKNNL